MKPATLIVGFVLFCIAAVLISEGFYIVRETDQVIITRFGEAIGDPKTEPGLKFKTPFIDKVNRLDKRILEWDGVPDPQGMPTADKKRIIVDSFARWRIKDPLLYFVRVTNERRAQSRLDDILGSETLDTISSHNLVEVIRNDKERVAEVTEEALLQDANRGLEPVRKGRSKLEQEILARAKTKLEELGIELLDIRFKRANYSSAVESEIHQFMINERQRVAERFRSEGEGEANRILGRMQEELKTIESEAYKEVQKIRGQADAEATRIYAEAYNQSPEAVQFYEFIRTMEIYKDIISRDTTMILSTDSDLFQYLKGVDPESRKEFSFPDPDSDVPLFLRDN